MLRNSLKALMLQHWKFEALLTSNISSLSPCWCTKLQTKSNSSSNAKDSLKRKKLELQVKDCFNFSEVEATRFIDKNKALWEVSRLKINKTIKFLLGKNVTTKTIIENPWIMTIPQDDLEMKIAQIEKLTFQDINDLAPLIRIPSQRFSKVLSTMKKDDRNEKGNRIYYLSHRLEVEPALVAKYFATHLFIFKISFEKIEENLGVMLEFGITPISILRDLWSFENSPAQIRTRLERCQQAGTPIGALKPWMVRCTEENFNKALKLTEERNNLLGDQTIVCYLSQRLNREREQIENLLVRKKFLGKVCVKKIKDVFDYLLIEEKIHPTILCNSIGILKHSLDKTKKRITELKLLGFPMTSLVHICYSQTEYNRYLERCRRTKESIKVQNC